MPPLQNGSTPHTGVSGGQGHFRRIIPCLDVDRGRVVKGTQFVDLRDAGDPVELAMRYEIERADELVFLDISATSDKRGSMVDLARAVADDVFIPFTVGGGVRSLIDAQSILDAGADKVSVNSAAVQRPELIDEITKVLATALLVVAIDAKRTPSSDGWEVFTAGGRIGTGIDAVTWAKEAAARGAGELLVTSMDRDGTKDGYDLDLTQAICDAVDVPVVASGGAGTVSHLVDAFRVGAEAVLCASIFHFEESSARDAKEQLLDAGVRTRLTEDVPLRGDLLKRAVPPPVRDR